MQACRRAGGFLLDNSAGLWYIRNNKARHFSGDSIRGGSAHRGDQGWRTPGGFHETAAPDPCLFSLPRGMGVQVSL